MKKIIIDEQRWVEEVGIAGAEKAGKAAEFIGPELADIISFTRNQAQELTRSEVIHIRLSCSTYKSGYHKLFAYDHENNQIARMSYNINGKTATIKKVDVNTDHQKKGINTLLIKYFGDLHPEVKELWASLDEVNSSTYYNDDKLGINTVWRHNQLPTTKDTAIEAARNTPAAKVRERNGWEIKSVHAKDNSHQASNNDKYNHQDFSAKSLGGNLPPAKPYPKAPK